jgi:hypothetical protein
MKLYDVDESQQDLVDDDVPVFDKSTSGEKLKGIKIF